MSDINKGAKRALAYTKRKGILTDAVDAGERFLLSKATNPQHEVLIKSLRGEVRRRYGVVPIQKLRDSLKVRKGQNITWLIYEL